MSQQGKSTIIQGYGSLASGQKLLVDSIVDWWKDAQFLTMGDRGERNVFDDAPMFIRQIEIIRNPEKADWYWNKYGVTFAEMVGEVIKWWDNFNVIDGERNIFDEEPDFVGKAREFVEKKASQDVNAPTFKSRETSHSGAGRTRSDGLPLTSKAEICAKWVAGQESEPYGIHPLVKGFLLSHPEYYQRFASLGNRHSPSQAKWENISKLMVLANESRRDTDPVLYPQAVFEAQLTPRIVQEFVDFAKDQGLSLQAIPSRDYSHDDGFSC